jgi:hypothetical protein
MSRKEWAIAVDDWQTNLLEADYQAEGRGVGFSDRVILARLWIFPGGQCLTCLRTSFVQLRQRGKERLTGYQHTDFRAPWGGRWRRLGDAPSASYPASSPRQLRVRVRRAEGWQKSHAAHIRHYAIWGTDILSATATENRNASDRKLAPFWIAFVSLFWEILRKWNARSERWVNILSPYFSKNSKTSAEDGWGQPEGPNHRMGFGEDPRGQPSLVAMKRLGEANTDCAESVVITAGTDILTS